MPLVKIYKKGSGGGGGGNAVIVLGAGALSSVRCGANNCANEVASSTLGCANNNSSCFGSILGGNNNSAQGEFATIVGGKQNVGQSNSVYGFIGNGCCNSVDDRRGSIINGVCNAAREGSTVAGGIRNLACGQQAFIGNGNDNCIDTGSCNSFIGGGNYNSVYNATNSFLGSGFQNSIVGGYGSIVGGCQNSISACPVSANSILTGKSNTISGDVQISSILAGINNCIFTDVCAATIASGVDNCIRDTSHFSSILGGNLNTIRQSVNSSIVNGADNSIRGGYSNFISSGCSNYSFTSTYSTILGGNQNISCCTGMTLISHSTNSYICEGGTNTILGGCANKIYGAVSSHIIGGQSSCIFGTCGAMVNSSNSYINGSSLLSFISHSSYATINDGCYNFISHARQSCIIGGANYSHILGGVGNCIEGRQGAILSGNNHFTNKFFALVVGGDANTVQGQNGVVLNGCCNQIGTGSYNTILNGCLNETTNQPYQIASGNGACATRFGERVFTASNFGTVGSSQSIELTLANTTNDNTPTQLFLTGSVGGPKISVLLGTAMNLFVQVYGIKSDGTRYGAKTEYVVVSNFGGTTSIVYQNTIEQHFTTGSWNITIQANNTDDTLDIICQGATGDTVRWYANVWGIQLTYGT